MILFRIGTRVQGMYREAGRAAGGVSAVSSSELESQTDKRFICFQQNL